VKQEEESLGSSGGFDTSADMVVFLACFSRRILTVSVSPGRHVACEKYIRKVREAKEVII